MSVPPLQPGFDERVWRAVEAIPQGQLATYGQIADCIGAWGAARQVGWALRRLPLPSPIPWHRVVNAQGRIAMSPSREGSDWIQRELLLVKVSTTSETRSQVLETVQLFRAKVVDVAQDAVTIEATGNAEKIQALLRVLEPYGIKELVQSGLVAMERGLKPGKGK